MTFSTDYYNHRGAFVVLLLLTAVILEVIRRLTGYPRFGDVRAMVVMAACSLAIAAASLLGLAFASRIWPFGP